MHSLKLFGVLAATIIAYLLMLYFKFPFGIALIVAMGIMWYGVKYVRQQDADEESSANADPEECTVKKDETEG